MKSIRNSIVLILGCLFFGAVAGWLMRGGGGDSTDDTTQLSDGETIWVSPMHPHIRQNEPGNCPICGMELVPLSQFTSGSSHDPLVLEMSPEAIAMANIVTTEVRKSQAGQQIELIGKIQANERGVQSLTANYAGRIDQLHVTFTGEEILKGQKIATMYSPEMINAQKELQETAKIKDRQPALYEAAKEKLKFWKLSEAQVLALEQRGETQSHIDVYADKSGVVSSRDISVGDFVSRGQVLFEVQDLGTVWVVLDAYESDIAAIKIGAPVSFKVSAYPSKKFSGKISFVDPLLNELTRTVSVRAEAPNPGSQLKPGMFVDATIESSTGGGSLSIPASAVLWTGQRSVVYVKVGSSDQPKFQIREVGLGAKIGRSYEVASGLEEGEEIVSNGVFAVDAAAQLAGNNSMMRMPADESMHVPVQFQRFLERLLQGYSPVKEGFVLSDEGKINAAIASISQVLQESDVANLDGKATAKWNSIRQRSQKSLTEISTRNDLDEKRKSFESLSDALIEAIDYFGNGDLALYKQYCPMAFGDKGAFWLSFEKEIRNPYFGEEMLTCGEVKKTYQARK